MSRPRGQAGFTMIEVLVAMVIAVIATVAILSTMEQGNATSAAQQRDTQASAIGEQQIEQARGIVKLYGFANLMLSSTPAPLASSPNDPVNPNALLTTSGGTTALRILNSWHDLGSGAVTSTGTTGGTPIAAEPLLVAAATQPMGADRLNPGPSTVTFGKTTATVWRYVSRVNEPSCTTTACQNDTRRVTVAVLVDNPRGIAEQRRTPVYFTTILDNPVPSDQSSGSGGLELGVNLP